MSLVTTIAITNGKSISVNYDDNTTYGDLRKSISKIENIDPEKIIISDGINRLQLNDKIAPILNKKNTCLSLIIAGK